jgi:hypothetical protein
MQITADRRDEFVTVMVAPGALVMIHYLMGMEDAIKDLYEESEAMHELIDYIAEVEFVYIVNVKNI